MSKHKSVVPSIPELDEHAAEIIALGRRSFADVVEIGRRLVRCRELLKTSAAGWPGSRRSLAGRARTPTTLSACLRRATNCKSLALCSLSQRSTRWRSRTRRLFSASHTASRLASRQPRGRSRSSSVRRFGKFARLATLKKFLSRGTKRRSGFCKSLGCWRAASYRA